MVHCTASQAGIWHPVTHVSVSPAAVVATQNKVAVGVKLGLCNRGHGVQVVPASVSVLRPNALKSSQNVIL